MPAVRFVCEMQAGHGTPAAYVRIPLADRGHDLQWLIDTGGDIEADHVARSLSTMIGGAVAAAPVVALHPDTESYSPMVPVRVTAALARAMRAMVGTCHPIIVRRVSTSHPVDHFTRRCT